METFDFSSDNNILDLDFSQSFKIFKVAKLFGFKYLIFCFVFFCCKFGVEYLLNSFERMYAAHPSLLKYLI